MTEEADAIDHDARIAKVREKFRSAGLNRDAASRGKIEKKQRKARTIRNIANRTDRSELFPFRCRRDLRERCKQVARERGVPIAAWMEQALEAAIVAHEKELGGSS